MEPKTKPMKFFIMIFVLFMFLVVVGSVILRNYNERKYPERFVDEVEVMDEGYDKSFPQIINEPVNSVIIGETYTFTPRVAPSDDSINLTLLQSPNWLTFDGVVVSGTPNELGTVSFILRIEKEGLYVDEEFFLVVTD